LGFPSYPLMLVLKLSLVALSMVAATWAGKRFGHRAVGLMAGFPLIMAPLVGLLLIDLPAERVADICWATLANFAALAGFILVMAWVVVRLNWWLSLLVASLAYFALTAAVSLLPVSQGWMVAIGLAVALFGPYAAPKALPPPGGVRVPKAEFLCRLVAAVGMAAAVLLLAPSTPPFVSAMLMTYPINGSVLPAFTRALYGGAAARGVLTGFGVGLRGVGVFLLATATGLEFLSAWPAYLIGLTSALAYAWWTWRADQADRSEPQGA
jgi:hypothetical protein